MKKTLLELYALAVCFGALAFIVVHSAEGLYDFVGIVAPTITMSRFQTRLTDSNEDYLEKHWRLAHKDAPVPDDLTVTRLRVASAVSNVWSERSARTGQAVKHLVFVIVNLVVFWLHWRIAERQRSIRGVPARHLMTLQSRAWVRIAALFAKVLAACLLLGTAGAASYLFVHGMWVEEERDLWTITTLPATIVVSIPTVVPYAFLASVVATAVLEVLIRSASRAWHLRRWMLLLGSAGGFVGATWALYIAARVVRVVGAKGYVVGAAFGFLPGIWCGLLLGWIAWREYQHRSNMAAVQRDA